MSGRIIIPRDGYVLRVGQNVRSSRTPAGFAFVDGQEVAQGMQCGHCNCHWIVQPGSGIQRGFCTKCSRVTCGKEECETECVPFEKRLDLYEKGLRDRL